MAIAWPVDLRAIGSAVERHLAGGGRAGSEERLGQRRLADAYEARDRDDFSIAQFEIERTRRVGKFQSLGRKDATEPFAHGHVACRDFLSEHRIDGTLIVQIRAFEAAGYAPVAQGDDAVGEPADVGHPVRDIKDRDPTGFQPVEKLEQPIGLGARERRRRLVEDQHLRLVRHGAGDRHHLPVGERQIVDISGKIYGEAHAGGNDGCLAPYPARVEEQARTAAVQPVEREVGRDVEVGNDAIIDVLVNRHHTSTDRLRRCCRRKREIIQLHGSGVSDVDAAEDAHQCRLSSAVGAHQHRHGTLAQFEIDALQNRYRPEGFAHALDAKHCLFAHALLPMKSG